MRNRLIASVVLGCALYVGCIVQAFAQTCAPATTTPTAARDEARLQWTAPTTNTDGSAIGAPITYRVYRSSGANSTSFSLRCESTAVTVSMLTQPVGVQNYRVTAVVGGNESAPSNVASKTVAAATPSPPTNLSLLEQLVAWLKSIFSRA
jgi:hypothetical protein